MTISKKGVANGDPLELLKLAFALNKAKLQEEFDKVKIKIENEKSLVGLANIVKKKLDVNGAIKNGDQVIMFDTMRILSNLGGYTQEQKDAVTKLLVD